MSEEKSAVPRPRDTLETDPQAGTASENSPTADGKGSDEGKSSASVPGTSRESPPPPDTTITATASDEKKGESGGSSSPQSSAEKSEDESAKPDENNTGGTQTFTVDNVVNAGGYGKFQKILTLLAGLGWLADAFAIIILSIIGDFLACDWEMQRWQNALMTSIVFFGMIFGAPAFGNVADLYGRRTALAISMLLLFIFGASCAVAPSYAWMVILRGVMGFSLGGIAQGVTLCCEYYPTNIRGRAGFYLSYYWTVGSLCVVLCAWLIMKTTNQWRVFVFVASVPALLVFLVMKWYPESARYYLVSNRPEKALKVLTRLTEWNKSQLPQGELVRHDAVEQRGRIQDLLKPSLRRTTLLFWYIWWAVSMTYYGIALITPILVTEGSLAKASKNKSDGDSFFDEFSKDMECKEYTDKNYIELLWTTAAEFPGLIAFTFLVEYTSRPFFLGTTCILVGLMVLFLQLEIYPQIALLLILFIARALIAGIFQLLFIMTTEAFPTTLRASAMGTGSACARIGGFIIPYVAQVLVVNRPTIAIFFISVLVILAGVAALCLPLDTRGREMEDVI